MRYIFFTLTLLLSTQILFAQFWSSSSNKYQGFSGLYLKHSKRQAYVERVLTHSPADKAGFHKKDLILSINGESTQNISLKAIKEVTQGKIGETKEFVFLRKGITDTISVTYIKKPKQFKRRTFRYFAMAGSRSLSFNSISSIDSIDTSDSLNISENPDRLGSANNSIPNGRKEVFDIGMSIGPKKIDEGKSWLLGYTFGISFELCQPSHIPSQMNSMMGLFVGLENTVKIGPQLNALLDVQLRINASLDSTKSGALISIPVKGQLQYQRNNLVFTGGVSGGISWASIPSPLYTVNEESNELESSDEVVIVSGQYGVHYGLTAEIGYNAPAIYIGLGIDYDSYNTLHFGSNFFSSTQAYTSNVNSLGIHLKLVKGFDYFK